MSDTNKALDELKAAISEIGGKVRSEVMAAISESRGEPAPLLTTFSGLCRMWGIGETTGYQIRAERDDFPKPVVLSPRCIRYFVSDGMAFAERLAAESVALPEPKQLAAGRSRGQARRRGHPPAPAPDVGRDDDGRPTPKPVHVEASV